MEPRENDDYIKWLDSKLEEYHISRKEREEFEKKQSEVNKLASKVLKLLNTIESNNLSTISDTIIDVGDMVSMEDIQTEDIETPAMIYEIILKSIKQNDSVSIPMSYYTKLKTTLRKNLYTNMDCTKYTSLVDIKFNLVDGYSILAVVEYDETLEDVRITVIKPYNKNTIDDEELVYYELKYNKIRKENSYSSLA